MFYILCNSNKTTRHYGLIKDAWTTHTIAQNYFKLINFSYRLLYSHIKKT